MFGVAYLTLEIAILPHISVRVDCPAAACQLLPKRFVAVAVRDRAAYAHQYPAAALTVEAVEAARSASSLGGETAPLAGEVGVLYGFR